MFEKFQGGANKLCGATSYAFLEFRKQSRVWSSLKIDRLLGLPSGILEFGKRNPDN